MSMTPLDEAKEYLKGVFCYAKHLEAENRFLRSQNEALIKHMSSALALVPNPFPTIKTPEQQKEEDLTLMDKMQEKGIG
jgi:hypothetical protein